MANPRHITISVQYDRHPDYGRSLAWIAPELRDAGLEMTDDQLDQATPSRSWAGVVDGPVFERFAEAWGLDDADSNPRIYVFDGMNWEAAGASPIVCVLVDVSGGTGCGPEGLGPRLCGSRTELTSVHAQRRQHHDPVRTVGARHRAR
jgi:hypothetical protein